MQLVVIKTVMNSESSKETEPVSRVELNSWRRGFTPQAEIWNGRMAMFALAVGLVGLVLVNRFFAS